MMTYSIAEMLTYRRAHDSEGEAEFIARYVAPVAAPVAAPDGTVHAFTVTIGAAPRFAFCAHTDSVHNRTLTHTRQRVAHDTTRGEYFVADAAQRDCLGADNAAGCYVLLRMIAERVPGLYVFFRGEERGGIGSGWIADNAPGMFAGIDAAIQFDRKDTCSVITEMMVGRTCSDAFADSLADALGMGHEKDNTGSFTDTANLSGIVAECTNVSVGYDYEHSAMETLDGGYLERLVDACVSAFKDGAALTIERAPGQYRDAADPGKGAELLGMTDDDIWWIVEQSTPEELAFMLMDARDEVERAHAITWRSH